MDSSLNLIIIAAVASLGTGTYFLIKAIIAFLFAYRTLRKAKRHLRKIQGLLDRLLRPIEGRVSRSKSGCVYQLNGNKARYYFILVQIRSALNERASLIEDTLKSRDIFKVYKGLSLATKPLRVSVNLKPHPVMLLSLDHLAPIILSWVDKLDFKNIENEDAQEKSVRESLQIHEYRRVA